MLDRNSVPAAIYYLWEKYLTEAVWELDVPRKARSVFPVGGYSTERLIHELTAPDGRFGEDPIAGRDAVLLAALDRAVGELEHRFGQDMQQWRFGQSKLKHVTIKHVLSDAVSPETRARLDVGPLPRGGYGATVNSTSDGENQTTGASFRLIADAGDWDRSLGTNSPGQSGDPDSPHYRDLFKAWSNGRYFPVFYTRAKVESVVESTVILVPARGVAE